MTDIRLKKTALTVGTEFTSDRSLKLLTAGCGLYALFTLTDIFMTFLSGGPSLDSAVSGVIAIALLYLTFRLFRLPSRPDKDHAGHAARASVIVFAVMIMAVLLLAVMYYTTYSIVNGLDAKGMAEYGLTQEDVDRVNGSAFFMIGNMLFSLMQALAFLFFSRALGDVRTMLGGMRPDRNACRPASMIAAVTAGFGIAAALLDLTGSFGMVNTALSVLYDIPCILLFTAMAFLCRHTADDVSVLKGAAK